MIFDEGYIELNEAARMDESKDNEYWSGHMDELLNGIFEYNAIGRGTSKISFKKDASGSNTLVGECINVYCHGTEIGYISIDEGHWMFIYNDTDMSVCGRFDWNDVVKSTHDMIDKFLPVLVRLCDKGSEYVELGEATLPKKKKKGRKYTDEEYEEMQAFIDSLDNSVE